jgi:hypothetical protein
MATGRRCQRDDPTGREVAPDTTQRVGCPMVLGRFFTVELQGPFWATD